jgi:hypothetical protein
MRLCAARRRVHVSVNPGGSPRTGRLTWSLIMQTQQSTVEQQQVQTVETVVQNVAPDFEVIEVEGCLSSSNA